MARLAKGGYIAYLAGEGTNKAPSHAGWGTTRDEASAAALYWPNQFPVRVVPFRYAPRWAQDEALTANADELTPEVWLARLGRATP